MEYGEGKIFYIDSTNAHGYISSNINIGSFSLSFNTIVNTYTNEESGSSIGFMFGSGSNNTLIMQEANCIPQSLLNEMISLNGYSDWFIPDRFQLDLLCHYNHSGNSYVITLYDPYQDFRYLSTYYEDELLFTPNELEFLPNNPVVFSSTSNGTQTSHMFQTRTFDS